MKTPVAQPLPIVTSVTHPQYLLGSQLIGLLRQALTLLEEITPQLGYRHQQLSGVEDFWQNGEWDESQIREEYEEEAEKVAEQQSQVRLMRLKLHTLLFGMGVENRRERGSHGCTTQLPDNLTSGDVMAALELIEQMNAAPLVSDEFEDDKTEIAPFKISLF